MRNITKILDLIKKMNIAKIATAFIFAIALFIAPSPSIASQLNENLLSTNLLATANKSETTYPTNDKNVEGLLYSDSNQVESLNNVDDFISPQRQKGLLDPTQIPAIKQPILDRSDPDAKLLEKTQQMFKDAGNF